MAILKSIVTATTSAPLARLLQVCFYALALLWLGGVFAAAAALAMYAPVSDLQLWGVLLAAIVIAALGVTVLSLWADLYGQRGRDIQAQAIFDALHRRETPPPYTLYLRPFLSTGAFSEIGAGASVAGMPLAGLGGAEIELEAQIEAAVRPLGKLVALGQPLEHIGAGRVLVDEQDWKGAIRLLMTQAKLIIMLPSSRQGTLEEIEMILGSDLIERTVFIDPPNLARKARFDHAADWKQVREAFETRGYAIPADSRAGLLLFFGRERAPQFKERLDIDADDRIERLFRRVIKVRTSTATNVAEAA
jgi:membrane protein implicated in regulation of membrane protease activity